MLTTAGSDEKCEAARKLGAAHAFNYRTADWVAEAQTRHRRPRRRRHPRHRRRRLHRAAIVDLLSLEGRLLQIAFLKSAKAELDFSVMMRKRAWITGSTLRPRTPAEKGAIARDLLEHVWPLFEQGTVAPVIHQVFPLAQAAAAHRLMEDQHAHWQAHPRQSALITFFTPRFFLMWSYSFTVFLSAFQLLPTAPFHILSLGGSSTEAGLFLGFLTYASAISAPITGAHRRSLRQAPHADHREPGDHRVLAALRGGAVVPDHPRPGARPRRVLVGPAVLVQLPT